jgi:hypothetical protein
VRERGNAEGFGAGNGDGGLSGVNGRVIVQRGYF